MYNCSYDPCSMCVPAHDFKDFNPTEYRCKDEDEDLKCLYPKIYFKTYPLIQNYCNILEKEKGKDYCPCQKEMDYACKEIYEKIKPQLDNENNIDDHCRQPHRYRRRHAVRDLIGIILINELLDRRRIRRKDHCCY